MSTDIEHLVRPTVLIFQEEQVGEIVVSSSVLVVLTNGLNAWFLPGGTYDPSKDASFEAAATREVGEETGLEVDGLELWDRFDGIAHRTGEYFEMLAYTAKKVTGSVVLDPTREIIGAGWLSPRNRHEFRTASTLGRRIIPKLIKQRLIY